MSEKSLNQAQQEAVEYTDGPLLIVAGAGTGKTTVITEKISHLIKNDLATPEQILALTFTDKAAGEMEERVDELLDIGYVDLRISTFHAFCQTLLEDFGLDIGLPNQFTLLSETDAWLLVREHLTEFNLEYYRPLGNPTRHIHELLKHFSKCKDELITPEQYLEYAENAKMDSGDMNIDEKSRLTEVANAYHTYNQLLLDNNALDFGDLLYYAVKLLEERTDVKKKLQDRFKYILVDEFQDVNWAQYKLAQLLSENSQLTVVGDDDQSIYAFRGASVSNILRFKDDFANAKDVVLNENYRSVQDILDTAYTSITHNDPDRLEPKLGISKKLIAKSDAVSKTPVNHIHCYTLDDEVQAVVKQIAALQKEDEEFNWGNTAILVRANNHAEPFIHALEKAAIPYEFHASGGLYRQPIVLDCVNFFKLLDQYKESSAVYRLLRLPFFAFKESDIHKLTGSAKKKSISYYEALKRAKEFHVSDEGITACNKLLNIIHAGMKKARFEKPSTVLYDFMEQSGYLTYLTHEEEQGNRRAIKQIYELKQFFDMVNAYEQAAPDADVRGFMRQYNYITESGDQGKLFQAKDNPDAVNIMTVHASKGLEFKYVFVVNMVEGRFPSRRRGGGIQVPAELIHESLPEGDEHYQEERRLFYVATTRAKEKLFLLSADDYGGTRKKKVSRFLDELGFGAEGKEPIGNQKVQKGITSKAEEEEYEYPLPKVFSFSQIKAYQSCPYQYKLGHILKIPTKGAAAFSFGQTMHSVMQKFYERMQELNSVKQSSLFDLAPTTEVNDGEIKVPSKEELFDMFENAWIDDWYKSQDQREDYKKKGKEILTAFYESEEGNWRVPVSLEGWFKIQIGDYLLHGRIDRIDQLDDGTLEIIDYKTGKSKEKLTSEDKEQLLIYQIAAQALPEYRNLGETSKLTFYYVNDTLKTSFIGENKDLEKLQEKITKTIDNIHSRNFKATPNKHTCTYCDFRDICEYRAS